MPRDWLALDDDYLGWTTECFDKYIRTHDYEGSSGMQTPTSFSILCLHGGDQDAFIRDVLIDGE